MTDLERLEQVKERLNNTLLVLGRSSGKTQLFKDINWLFEQAEKFIQTKSDETSKQETDIPL